MISGNSLRREEEHLGSRRPEKSGVESKDTKDIKQPTVDQKRADRVAQWKQKQLQKKVDEQAPTPGTGQSPAITAPTTPAAPQPPVAVEVPLTSEPVQPQPTQPSQPSQPVQFHVAPVAKSLATALSKTPIGNMASFGLKARAKDKVGTEIKVRNNVLLDDEDKPGKRILKALPVLDPEGADVAEDADMDDEDVVMKDAGNNAPGNNGDDEEDDDDDEDPLEAYMKTLKDSPTSNGPRGQAFYGDELDIDMTDTRGIDDSLANPIRKKRKEMPVVDHSKMEYAPFRKDFYVPPEEITKLSVEELADLRLEMDGIKVKPDDAPRPVVKFAQMGLLQSTMDALQHSGFVKPTPIQSQAIPTVLSGRDVRAVAKTGSGKTLAFGLPSLRHILDQPPLKHLDGPIGLILAPTRELVVQIQSDLRPFFKASALKIACVYGGSSIADNIALLKRSQTHILVATPGRLIDLMQSNSGRVLNFKRVTYIVLDEADRMFDMGFEPQIMKILANIRPDRQTLLFSATFPKSLDSHARRLLHNPVEIIIGGRSTVPAQIKQIIEPVSPTPADKFNRLLYHLGNFFSAPEHIDGRALVFCERQEMCEDLLLKLLKRGYACNSIHGAKEQTDRDDAINDFKSGALPLLIATSVAARGLDVAALALVINYDSPSHTEDYVHRVGRTGRAGRDGTAITLLERPGQERLAVFLVKALKDSGSEVPEELQIMADEFSGKIKAGTEKWYGNSGFGGKGLDKLDQVRAVEKRREKRAHKGEFEDDSDSEPEAAELPTIPTASATTNVTRPPTPTATNSAAESSLMAILNGNIVVNKTQRATGDNSNLSHVEQAKYAAAEINARLGQKGRVHHGQPIDNKGPDSGAFHSTLEINDFPQKARWAVTNRTNISKVLDSTGTSITTKGNFYPPGKKPGENDPPKLYILVEGDTEAVVLAAMTELTRLLREGTMAAQDEGSIRGATGKYHVV